MDPVHIPPNPENTHYPYSLRGHSPYFKRSNSPLYSSEWGDIDNSPSRKMQSTIVETPKKVPVHLVTPKSANAILVGSTKYQTSQADLAAPTPGPRNPQIQTIDVVWAMVNDITGKDKLAKFGQYSLRLLLHHSQKTQAYLSDDVVNIKLINSTYASTEKVLDLVMNFVRNPRAFARVLGILVCLVFTLRLSGVVPALGLYRQLLRFGKSPFRIRGLYQKIKEHVFVDDTKTWRLSPSLFTNATLGEVVSLYYSLSDETLLLFKLKVLRNETVRKLAGRHEAFSWYSDSWLGLYNAYTALQRLTQQEMDVKILIQVKKRARAISRQLLGGTALHTSGTPSLEDDSSRDMIMLKEIQFKKTNATLDIYKLLSDLVFNSYTVFKVPLHFDTVQIWMGISASFLSSVKLFREKKRAMVQRV